jgi:hypothetical protein
MPNIEQKLMPKNSQSDNLLSLGLLPSVKYDVLYVGDRKFEDQASIRVRLFRRVVRLAPPCEECGESS